MIPLMPHTGILFILTILDNSITTGLNTLPMESPCFEDPR